MALGPVPYVTKGATAHLTPPKSAAPDCAPDWRTGRRVREQALELWMAWGQFLNGLAKLVEKRVGAPWMLP